MPIFEYEGKKYNVNEEHIENFINDFPNATTILERDGKKYRVKSSDYSSFLSEHITKPITKEDIPTSNFTGREQTVATNPVDQVKQESNNEPEYAKGFGEGFKQGWKGLVRGAHYFIGETANLLTGSTIDEEKALERIAELERDGIDIESAIAPLDKAQEMYYKNATNQSGETKLAGLTDNDITYAQKELEKDAINRTIRKYIEKAGGIDKAKLMLAERASEETWGDRQIKIASQELAELKPTKGFGAWVGNLVPQMIPSAASIGIGAVTKNPKLTQGIGMAGMSAMTVSTAGMSMNEAREAGATGLQTWAVGIADGAIEFVTEKIPFNRYTSRVLSEVKKKVGSDLSEAITNSPQARNELERLLQEANKRLGGKLFNGKNVKDFAGDIVAEGLSEFTAEALQTITPLIYENPEDYPTIGEILRNGWEGAKAGIFMGSVLGGASKTMEHYQQRNRRKEQGFVDIVEFETEDGYKIGESLGMTDRGVAVITDGKIQYVIPEDIIYDHKFSFEEFDRAELQMENEESFDNGYSLSEQQEMNDAKNMLEVKKAEMIRTFGFTDESDIEAFLGENPIETVAQRRQNGESEESTQTIIDYLNAKATYDGMSQRVRDDIDGQIEQSNALIDSHTNKHTGKIHGAVSKEDGRLVYIVSGNVVPHQDGSGIDLQNSDENIIIRDAETGELKQMSPEFLSYLYDTQDPNEQKEINAQQIREKILSEESNKIDGVVDFNDKEQFLNEAANKIAITIILAQRGLDADYIKTFLNNAQIVENPDGTLTFTDGQNKVIIPKQEIQQQVDAASMQRAVDFNETVKQTRNAITQQELDNMTVERNGVGIKQPATEHELVTNNSTEEKVSAIGRSLSQDESNTLISEMESHAIAAPEIELTPDNWISQFGEDGIVSTPIGNVKMGENQIAKLFQKGRSAQFGMIKPTLENPDVIIEETSNSLDGNEERNSSLLFVKTFIGKDGEKVYFFKSVTVKKDGLEVSISSHLDRPKRIKEALEKGKLLYRFDGGAQTEHHPADVSVTASPENMQGSSEDKDSKTFDNNNSTEEKVSAASLIPKDEHGNPIYEQADPSTAWDALVEEAERDEEIVTSVVQSMIADKEKELSKLEKAKVKDGTTPAEKTAAHKAHKIAVELARQEVEAWKNIANAPILRKQAEMAERQRIEDEKAAQRKAEEERIKSEQEEAARIEREMLNGIPDIIDDTPQDARARGYRRINGHLVERQQPIQAVQGKETDVEFSNDVRPKGHYALIESSQLQPSHIHGNRNPLHFLDEAQPKERNDEASIVSAQKIAGNIRPATITTGETAYVGTPTINTRGEVIQGNSRSDALRLMWNNHQEQGQKYKQHLIDNAEQFGLNPEDVSNMENPVLVRMLDVNDEQAITLGQYVAQDTESGGIERIKPKNTVKKMGNDIGTYANLLLNGNNEDMSFAELLDNNGVEVLKWMAQKGYITPTQYDSQFDTKGNLTAEAKNDLRGIMYQSIFEGGNTRLEEMFNALPAKAQKAILATAHRDFNSPNSERMMEEIQNSIRAFYALMQDEQFAKAKNYKDAMKAVEAWQRQYQMDDVTGESYLPSEKFTNFALELATLYKGNTQSFIQNVFTQMYNLIQGTQQDNLFEQADNTPRTLVQAIKEVLNIDYNGRIRSNVLGNSATVSQQGESGSDRDAGSRERTESGEQTADGSGRATGNSGRSGIDSEDRGNQSKETKGSEITGQSMTADEAHNFIAMMELNAEVAPEIELTIENWDSLFGEDGIVSTPIGDVKMGENQFAKLMRQGRDGKLGMIKPTLENPDVIIEYDSNIEDNAERQSSYIFIRTFKKADGSRYYYFTSITVSKDGKEVVVSNQEKKKNRIQKLLEKGSVIWRTPKDATTSSAERQGLDYEQSNKAETAAKGSGITPQSTSVDKDTTISHTNNELEEKVSENNENNSDHSLSEQIKSAEKDVNTSPTDKQKEAGNYKKGHVQIGTFNVTIEQPKGSVRSGVDANGKKWETTMYNTYGYIRGTEGVDGDHIDVFLSDDIDGWNGRLVFVVDQYNEDGSFDEHKVMMGFNSVEDAESAYMSNYEKGWKGLGAITSVPVEEFEKWIQSSHRKTKPFTEYKSVKTEKTAQQNTKNDDLVEESSVTTQSSYTITPAQYTTKKGKVLDMHLVKFSTNLTKEQQHAAKELAKSEKGWYDAKQGGFMMRSEESSRNLVNTILHDEEAVNDAQPVSMDNIKSVTDGEMTFTEPVETTEKEDKTKHAPKWQYSVYVNRETGRTTLTRDDVSGGYPVGDASFEYTSDNPEEMLEILRNPHNGMQDVLESVETTLENRIRVHEMDRRINEMRTNGVNGYNIGDKVSYKGKEATIHDFEHDGRPVLDVVLAPVMYEVAEWDNIKNPQQNQPASSQNNGQDLTTGFSIDNVAETSAKIRINTYGAKREINNLIHKYVGQRKTRGFISDLARALGDRSDSPKQTYYFEFNDKSGNEYTLRISNHNVNAQNADENKKEISIVIKSRRNPNKFISGNTEIKEYVYFKESIANGDGQTLAWIAQDIATMLDTGVFADSSGIAVVNTSPTQEQPKQIKSKNEGQFGLVSDERMAELKERLRKKLGGQMNIGIDPEILTIGLEVTVGYLDRGVKTFTDFAKVMITDLGDAIRPYLKAFYNGARDLPEVTENGLADDMTPYDEVQTFDVTNFDKSSVNAFATAETVIRESEVEQEVETAKERIKKTRNKNKSKKKSVNSQGQTGSLFDDLFNNENSNDDGLLRNDKEIRSEGLSADNNIDTGTGSKTGNSQEVQQESGRTDGNRDGGSQRIGREIQDGDKRSSGRLPRIAEKKNTRNNRSERGKDHAPTSVDARIEANIKAIELAKQLLENGEQATAEQMEILRKFSGWGGLGKAFREKASYTHEGRYYYNEPTIENKKLRELLGNEAYQQAVMSANSSYYTPAYIIDTLWDIAEKMGFKGGNILEGSAGIGNILGQMPTHISERSDIHAIEIDGTSGGILSLLYPDANVEIQGFEETRIANGSVDLAITNVPFVTGLRVNDTTGDKDLSKRFHNIHDFCIAKNIRKLREGGLGIFITSNGTLDSSKKLRDWIINEGNSDFVGAFRMHNETFGGTRVTSDIIVIKKRVNGQKSANAIDVSTSTGERVAEFNTGETRKVKGNIEPVIKQVVMDYNRYFMEHPENMAGEMKFGFEKGDTYRPASKGLYPVKGKDQDKLLTEFVNSFKVEEFGEAQTTTEKTPSTESASDKKVGEMFVKDGVIYINSTGYAQPLNVNANKVKGHTKAECFNAYSAIKETLAEVLEYQTKHENDNGLNPLITKLNKAYDDFVKTYGHFNKNTAIAFLRNDVDYANVASIETYKEIGDGKGGVKQTFGKADVMKKRVIEKDKEPTPTNVKDGIIASLFIHGRVDIPYIANQLGLTEDDVKRGIIDKGLGFENPVTRQMEVSYQYLSGNVREKLLQARENNENGEFDRNIKALQDVLPMDIPAHLIDFTLGSSWVEPELYNEYVKDRTDVDVKFTAVGGTWFMKEPYFTNYEKNRSMGVTSEMLGKTIMGHTLIEAAIQNKSITVSTIRKNWDGTTETIVDKEATQACASKIDEIRQDFKEWARQKMQSDPEMSAKMERIYNDTFNNYVPMKVTEEFLPKYFIGAIHKYEMRPHQKRAIVRGTMQPLMLAHEVGSGKTFTLISTAMEMRRLGTARKPMIVVQNATVGQFVANAKELYPNAKILTLEDSDRNAEGRKNFYAKIKYNDWDMIIIPQSTFEFIPDSEEREMAFVQDKIEEKMLILEQMKEADPDGNSMITRQAEREIALLEEELAELSETASMRRTARDEKKRAVALQNAEVKAMEMLDRRTDDVENFDDMGIDALLIDEAHEYKHLGFATVMQRGVKGVDPSYSKKSQGVFLKAQAVLEKNNGRNVIFATGTPISNTAAEIWTFMRYLMPADTMKEYGIYYFDDFVRNFGNIQQMLEFTTSGKFKENNRFAGYVNLPELVRIWSGVSDTVNFEDIEEDLKKQGKGDLRPDIETGKAQDIYLPQTRALRSIMKFVKAQLEEYDQMSGKQKKENSHIPLTMYGIAKAAAVDARLVEKDAEDDPNSKTNEAVRQTLRSLKETENYKGTVAIFADNYQNKHTGFNLYEDIRTKLIAEGVNENEIVVIKSGMTVKKKLEIFEKVNRGEIRVILGSTFTLGTGVNIQERLHTLIHLDAPNRPMDYTQRNGRILRQGNIHKEMGKPVRVLRFGVEDSLDVTAYQRLKTKGAIADSIMNGKQMMSDSMNNRVLEEEEDVFGDTVAQLSGSEYAMLKNNAEKNVRKYESRKKQWEADQTYIHNAKPRIKGLIKDAETRIELNSRNLKEVQSAFPDGKFKEITIGKKRFTSIESMEDFFKEYNKSIIADTKKIKDGEMSGNQTRELTIQIGDYSFIVKTELTKEYSGKGMNLFAEVHRKMTYSCPQLGIEDAPVRQALLRNGVEDIVGNVITGKDFAERLESAERSKYHNESELEQLMSREGKPFEYEKELEQAKKQFIKYSELMKKEMAEKEAKYAEMDASVESATDINNTEEDDKVLYRYEDTKDKIEELFYQSISGNLKGKPIPIGRLTNNGKVYLEQISGISFKENVDFVLNPSDLIHIYKGHFGNNETDERSIPLDIEDIRSIVDVISFPDKIIYTKEVSGERRKMFFFLKEAENGTYNLLEIYADKKGNLTAKTFYKTKEGVSQRAMTLSKSLHTTSKTDGATLSSANIPQMFESSTLESENLRNNNNEFSSSPTRAQRRQMIEHVEDLAKRLHLDNIEIVNSVSGLEGKKKGAKGFFSKKSGKITIVVPNHTSIADIEKTLLHEAVAHYGLRKLFGKHFDTFLDNVFNNVDESIRRKIVELASKKNWDFRTATEEYLASLAERTNFKNVQQSNWWQKIKYFFADMLSKLGFKDFRGVTLTDNELRYILWRSYENFSSNKHNGIFGEAADTTSANRNDLDKSSLEANKFLRTIMQTTTDDELRKHCSTLITYINEGIYSQLPRHLKTLAREYKNDRLKIKQDEYTLLRKIETLIKEYHTYNKQQQTNHTTDPQIIISETFIMTTDNSQQSTVNRN